MTGKKAGKTAGKIIFWIFLIAIPALACGTFKLLKFTQELSLLMRYLELDITDILTYVFLGEVVQSLAFALVGFFLCLRALLRPVRERWRKTVFALDTFIVIFAAAAVLCSVARIVLYGELGMLRGAATVLTEMILRTVTHILILLTVWPKRFVGVRLQLVFALAVCLVDVFLSLSLIEQMIQSIVYSGLTPNIIYGLVIVLFGILVAFFALAPKLRLKSSEEPTPCEEPLPELILPEDNNGTVALEQSTERGMRPMGEITREQYNEFVAESKNPLAHKKRKKQ